VRIAGRLGEAHLLFRRLEDFFRHPRAHVRVGQRGLEPAVT
jgi:hypothetical protein